MSEEAISPGDDLLTVAVVRDANGYGMKVSGDNPVYVQSVKEGGAAWRAGLRAGDRILKVDHQPVHNQTHQRVVLMIRANPTVMLTVQQNSRQKTPITAPVPVDSEKQYQLAVAKLRTLRLMLDNEEKHVKDLRVEVAKVPDVRKQAEIESGELIIAKFKHEMDIIAASLPDTLSSSHLTTAPSTPKINNRKSLDKNISPSNQNVGFLSGLPRSLSNLTGQSLRNLRQGKQKTEPAPVIQRQHSEDKRRHNNTVPLVPTTCLDNTPPPLPPRASERPKRPNVPANPLAKPKPSACYPNQSVPGDKNREEGVRQLMRSSQSLDGEFDGPRPNSIALQMSYPLVHMSPPPLQTDNRTGMPIVHVRSQSSPEHLDHGVSKTGIEPGSAWSAPPPPGTPPPPYVINTTPCADPQRAIISMEEDDSPNSETSTNSGLFTNLRCVLESKARTAVLLSWLLGERRESCATLLLVLTDGYRNAQAVTKATLRRWAYEIQSTFLMPDAVLKFNGVDENMANEIEQVLANEYEKEDLLRNVFRKARQCAKEEVSQQLAEFQLKRQLGFSSLYSPPDSVLERCDTDRHQEQSCVERLLSTPLTSLSGGDTPRARATTQALQAAAALLGARPASIAAWCGGSRGVFLQRDKPYKQRLKLLNKRQNANPLIVRGHHLQLEALTSVAHCHYCDLVIWGLAPQAYLCTDCKLRVHRNCVKSVEEPCCIDTQSEQHNNRISRFMDRIHNNQANQDGDKKSRKSSSTSHFLNMERSFRKMEDEPTAVTENAHNISERRDGSNDSLYESADQSDVISQSDETISGHQLTAASHEALKLPGADEAKQLPTKKGHRKALSLSNPLEIMKSIGDDWLDHSKFEKEKMKSQDNLLSTETDAITRSGSDLKLEQTNKDTKKDKNDSRKSSGTELPKTRKTSKGTTVSALNFLRRKKTLKSEVELTVNIELFNVIKVFIDEERKHSALCDNLRPVDDDDESGSDVEVRRRPDTRRRLSRQSSRAKIKARGKSQSVKVNTLRKSHSGTLKKGKKKGCKTPIAGRSRQTSIVDSTPILKKKNSEGLRHNSWLFSAVRGENRREGSTEETLASEQDIDTNDAKDNDRDSGVSPAPGVTSASCRSVSRAESCRGRGDAPRQHKHRNASDPNRLTANKRHSDLETGVPKAPSGSSSSSSLSSRSNDSNTLHLDQQESPVEWSSEEECAGAWGGDAGGELSPAHRKRQEVIHELIVSEGSHVRWLKVLSRVFLRPLSTQPALLPPVELKALFPNLPQVRERHSRLYAELRRIRSEADKHVVQVGPVADAMLNMLGEPGYASCLSRFCASQRLALESLRARRRKNKELHQYLASRETLPLCARLQLKDLLACVWQRLTKYQLLLEGIVKTLSEEEVASAAGVTSRAALHTAKEVLHSVDTAIRTAENEHRLRTIQSKLDVRSEWEELRKLDLTKHNLMFEGELTLRSDAKRLPLLGVMLEEALVLLTREGDRFVLRPLAHQLSPIVKWDKVLFRPNAAVRNTFFLMNINGVQMHELSANTAAEYTTWVKYIQEAPLAKLTELKPANSTQHSKQNSSDTTSTNVSRNPSDASEKSANQSDEPDEPERAPSEHDNSDKDTAKDTEGASVTPGSGGVGTVARSVTERDEPVPALSSVAVACTPPHVHTATMHYSTREQLRRIDDDIGLLLQRKCLLVSTCLGLPAQHYAHMAELAVADTQTTTEVNAELCSPSPAPPASLHHLLLAAHAQVQQLTEALSGALQVDDSTVQYSRSGLCTGCSSTYGCETLTPGAGRLRAHRPSERAPTQEGTVPHPDQPPAGTDHHELHSAAHTQVDNIRLASSLVPLASGLSSALSQALACVQDDPGFRAARLVAREAGHTARHRQRLADSHDELSPACDILDQSTQGNDSNGG